VLRAQFDLANVSACAIDFLGDQGRALRGSREPCIAKPTRIDRHERSFGAGSKSGSIIVFVCIALCRQLCKQLYHGFQTQARR
jgi:hypothetical protein